MSATSGSGSRGRRAAAGPRAAAAAGAGRRRRTPARSSPWPRRRASGPTAVVGQAVEQGVRVRLEPDRLAAAGRLGRLERRLGRLRPGAAAAGAQRVQAAVGRDPVQPGAQRRPGPRTGRGRARPRAGSPAARPRRPGPSRESGSSAAAARPGRAGDLAEGLVIARARPLEGGVCRHLGTDTGRRRKVIAQLPRSPVSVPPTGQDGGRKRGNRRQAPAARAGLGAGADVGRRRSWCRSTPRWWPRRCR